ncbi:sirohydrochlorin cobaltochelatase [Sporomusa sp. KB1]|jgi:sirohydrochlorin cobaltochelatase|uniref:sirohydrochlorin cobaltochelatase n=1 Tax=Sporomusa sp. KB1 TaxID=943346 RepID=UPI0011AB9ECD|nr:sirohydrochlorin cobaltochelatase [Sporomusa sp. KB1]TWH47437.1 sirohydrochlorin cobaltochelatase [Sporomusa sp. KB1]
MNQEQAVKKQAIVVVSFGTSYPETLMLNIESVENRIRAAFPDYEVRRAFTSRTIIKRLAERDGVRIDNERQALERLQTEGYQEVYLQPLHIVPGAEYDKIKELVCHYAQGKEKVFEKIRLARPLLYCMGQDNHPDDYEIAIKALATQLPEADPANAVVLMGHGGMHPANAAYGILQLKLEDAGFSNVFVYTVEGFPSLSRIINKLKQKQVKKVTLMPFLLVAGDHATNDMAGEAEGSAKSQLVAAGFEVDVYFRGLGENIAIQDIYVGHLKAAILQPPHGYRDS